ncbi:pyrroline-5-carboxylate reductase [Nitrosophilus labii]|uniref:pyrroline-5-carboxylate reductase n=1 Tax=Nitrosophilus labii TaxID=2706014 RepID=UPI0016572750|nr:pyrroline-5-carboxylate reductase [Nitrosophilus labii]
MKKEISIIGTGKMAYALIDALRDDFNIEVIGRNNEKLSQLKDNKIATKTFKEFDSKDKIVILAVKPHALKEISKYFKNSSYLLISVLAGTTLEELKQNINSKTYIRAMPNLAAIYKKSMTTITGDENAKLVSINIFEKIGEVLWVDSEKELDIATAIAGSGPAFLALVAEAIMDAGVKEGLKREYSKKLTHGLFEGFSHLLKQKHPAILKDEVMSPAGTTAAGYAALEKNATRNAFIKAITAAFEKTQKK